VEVLKIVGGLAAIAVAVAVIAMDREAGDVTAAAAAPTGRSFAAQDSTARFVVPQAEPADGRSAAAGAAATD
jgi:hypothetical protein